MPTDLPPTPAPPAVFEDREEEEQERNLRDEDDHRPDSGEDAVRDQILDRSVRPDRRDTRAQPADTRVDPIHDRLRQPEDRYEQRGHDRGEDQQSPKPVQEDAIDAIG